MHNFIVHSNESVCRKGGRFGLKQVVYYFFDYDNDNGGFIILFGKNMENLTKYQTLINLIMDIGWAKITLFLLL